MLYEEKVRAAGVEAGIKMMGFTGNDPLQEWLKELEERKKQGKTTSFERTPPKTRIDYLKAFEETKSVIVIGVPYYQKVDKPKIMSDRGEIASVAWGRDYHQVVMEKMNRLGELLKKEQPDFEYKAYVDNSRLVDRGTAWRAGLGFFGKNNTLINPRYGSFFFIGLMLVNLPIKYEWVKPLESQCEDCQCCVKACPNGALENGHTLLPNRCISYLTQKKKLTIDEEKMFFRYLYGCDICQLACPYNADLEITMDFKVEGDDVYPELNKIIKMDDVEFEEKFAHTAAGWRGKEILARNATIIKNK